MADTENKVLFGLKNVYYAVYDSDAGSFGTPVSVPGAVNISLSAQGDITKFYADDMVYYQSENDMGYEGDLEVARLPDSMLTALFPFAADTNNVVVENSTLESKTFALLFQITGDADNECYCLYSCTATRPNLEGKTREENKDPQTRSFTISAVPMADGKVMARTKHDTTESVKTGWFSAVYTGVSAS